MTTPYPSSARIRYRTARLGQTPPMSMTDPRTPADEVRRSLAALRQLFSAAACSFAQVEPDGESLRFVAADGAGADEITGVVLPATRGVVGWVAMSGEAIQVSDVTSDRRFARDVAETTNYVPETILAVPVLDATGETIGVVELLDPRPVGRDPGRDLDVAEMFAAQLASLLALLDGPAAHDDAAEGIQQELSEATRSVAEAGPEAARLATTLLRAVAAYRGPGR